MSVDAARRILVVPPEPAALDAVRREWPDSRVVGGGRRRSPPLWRIAPARRLARQLERFDPDLVVTTSAAGEARVRLLRKRRGFGVPVMRFTNGSGSALVPVDWSDAHGSWPVRREDALFVYTDVGNVAQQLGAVVVVGPVPGVGPLTAVRIRALLAGRIDRTVTLRRRLVSRGRWRRPGWRLATTVNLVEHVEQVEVSGEDSAGQARRALDSFWSRRMPTDRPPWEMLVVHGLPGGEATVAMKLHHALVDGLSAIGTLGRLLDLVGTEPADDTPPAPARSGRPKVGLVARGLWNYARSGLAPTTRLNGPILDLRRSIAMAGFPTDRLRATAKSWGVRTSELVVAAVTEAFSRIVADSDRRRIRLMVPVSLRSVGEARTYGNWTATLTVDVPLGPMTLADRLRAVAGALHDSGARGQPVGAAFALRALGLLPPPLHRAVCRTVYSSHFFNAVVSYVPGAREPRELAGAPIRAAYPVLGLASGVRIAIGVMPWHDTTGISVLSDRASAAEGRALVDEVHAALTEYATTAEA